MTIDGFEYRVELLGDKFADSWVEHLGAKAVHLIDHEQTSNVLFLIVGCLLVLIGLMVLWTIFSEVRDRHFAKKVRRSQVAITPADFLQLRSSGRLKNFEGVYVIHNETRDLFYVGQSIHVIDRLYQHFSGHGNGDVYADYRYNNEFALFIIPLAGSGYRTLNSLEKDTIRAFNAYNKGYNRTRGNAG